MSLQIKITFFTRGKDASRYYEFYKKFQAYRFDFTVDGETTNAIVLSNHVQAFCWKGLEDKLEVCFPGGLPRPSILFFVNDLDADIHEICSLFEKLMFGKVEFNESELFDPFKSTVCEGVKSKQKRVGVEGLEKIPKRVHASKAELDRINKIFTGGFGDDQEEGSKRILVPKRDLDRLNQIFTG